MISYYKRMLKDPELRELKNFEKGCWINVTNPTKRDINSLSKTFNLDKQNLISGLDINEVPRVEFDEGNVYIIVKTVSPQKELNTFLIIITRDFILTLSKEKPTFINAILEGKKEFITTQRPRCLLKLFSLINKEFEKSTLNIVKMVNLKRKSFNRLTEKDIAVLLEDESVLNSFISSYYYANLVYERVIKNMRFFEQDRDIIEDLMIEAKQGLDLCKSSLRTITNIRNHFVILLSNKLNKIINLLTVFTILISVPSAISGIYGMNVALPLQSEPHVFQYIVLLVVVIWIAFLFYFKKKKIL